MFLLDVAKDANVFGTDHPAIAQQRSGIGGIEQALIGDRGIHEALGADEACADRVGHGQRRPVRPGEDLHAEGSVRPDGLAHPDADSAHRRNDLRTDLALEVGGVVHVLDDHAVESGRDQQLRLFRGLLRDFGDAPTARARAPRERTDVHHAEQRLAGAEDVDSERDHVNLTSNATRYHAPRSRRSACYAPPDDAAALSSHLSTPEILMTTPAQTALERTSPELLACCRGDEPCDTALVGGFVLNVFTREFLRRDIGIKGGRIARIDEPASIEAGETVDCADRWLVPGFLDAHMHVESTMLPPSQFVRLASPHGTTGAVFDPHEIANVLGAKGIRWLMDDAQGIPLHAMWGVSSCVPSAPLENAGAELSADDLRELFDDPDLAPDIVALAEMMNFPGVVHADPGVLAKVALGLDRRIVDGHAPGLSGPALQAYVASGVSSDHECTTLEEAQEKLALGQRIFIREGSAARNLDALIGLITAENAHRICFCTDDRHPGDLREHGHIDNVVRRAIALGLRPELAFCIGSLNVAEHYRQPDLGAIAPGRFADILVLSDREAVTVEQTWFRGELVAEDGEYLGRSKPAQGPPRAPVRVPECLGPGSFEIRPERVPERIRVIGMHADQLVTESLVGPPTVDGGCLVADPEADLLKLAVIERHRGTGNMGLGFVTGFGFRGGAIASTVGHDAHNLAIVGDDDQDMALAARTLADCGGGQCVVSNGRVLATLPLTIAGLMSDQPADAVIRQQANLLRAAASLGCPHHDPFMPLSFLPLPVIPHLKLTDLGLVDVDRFEVVPLAIED